MERACNLMYSFAAQIGFEPMTFSLTGSCTAAVLLSIIPLRSLPLARLPEDEARCLTVRLGRIGLVGGNLVLPVGIEPTTQGFSDPCSTD